MHNDEAWTLRAMAHPRGKLPALIIILIGATSMLLVDPRGEFPLNDDWSFSRSAFTFARETRVRVDEWCAMSLVGQTLYGGVLSKIFGAEFIVLRVSTLILSLALSLTLWRILVRLNATTWSVGVFLLAWIFNPIAFCLSFTFMTEIPFLFFVCLGIYLFLRALDEGRSSQYAACGGALAYAFLIRQTAGLFVCAMIATLALTPLAGDRRRRFRNAMILLIPAAVALSGYYLWLHSSGGATPATRRKFELLSRISSEQILGNLFGALFYLSFMVLPILVYLLPSLSGLSREMGKLQRRSLIVILTLISASGLWYFQTRYSEGGLLMSRAYHARMPLLLNILYDTGLGPLTLDPTYYRPSPTPVYPNLWDGVTIAVGAGLVILGVHLSVAVTRVFRPKVDPKQRAVLAFSLLSVALLVVFEVLFSHLEEGGLFDRHILIPSLPLLLGLAALHRKSTTATEEQQRSSGERGERFFRSKSASSVSTWLAILVLALMSYFCVTATHDYLRWNRLRWELGRELLGRRVDPLTVAGGFEFNGWHNYDVFRSRGNIGKVFYWWYDKRTYLIAMSPEEGYEVADQRNFFSWVHRIPVTVYLLKKPYEN